MRRERRIQIGVLVAFLVLGLSACGKDYKKLYTEKKSEIEARNRENIKLSSQLEEEKEKNSELQTQLTEANQKIADLEANLIEVNKVQPISQVADKQSAVFLETYFWLDGKKYKVQDEEKFYADCNLTGSEVGRGENMVFLCDRFIPMEMSNGLTVYLSRSEAGYVYSAHKPSFKEIK